MRTYTTIHDTVLDLSELTDEERAYFERCAAAYRAGMRWGAFSNLVTGPDNPLLRPTGGRVTRAVWEHPLFQAVSDLEDRLGIQQGELEPEGSFEQDPLGDEWLSVARAAEQKGVTVQGLHKAIARGDVIAHPAKAGGTRLAVSARSLRRWAPSPRRQRAGRLVAAQGKKQEALR